MKGFPGYRNNNMNAQSFLCQLSVTFSTGDIFETQPCRQELLPIQTSLRAFCRRHRHWILLCLGFVPSLAKIPKKYPFISGMAIERFQAFAVYKNHRHITRSSINTTLHKCVIYVSMNCRKFSIGWFLSSWTMAILFVMILLTQARSSFTIYLFRIPFH